MTHCLEPLRSLASRPGLAAVMFGLLLVTAGCDQHAHHDHGPKHGGVGSDGKPVITVSIFPLGDLAGEIVGEHAHVHVLLPPGSSPHGFTPSPQQTARLSRTNVLATVGLGLDGWAAREARNANAKGLITLAAGVLLGLEKPGHDHAHDDHGHGHHEEQPHDHAHHDHAGPDPHVWLDPALMARWVDAFTNRLVELYPDRADAHKVWRANAKDLTARLQALDEKYRDQLGYLPREQMVTFHNAFDRLEKYGLKVVAHLTEIDLAHGGEVSPKRLAKAIEIIKSLGLPVIYAEPQFPEEAVKALQRETGVTILRLDPLGNPQSEEVGSYFKMMETNLQTLVQGQSTPAGTN